MGIIDNKFSKVSKGNMSFLFYAPKKDNEVEKEDEIFFSISEEKYEEPFWDEEPFYKWSKRKEVASV